MRVVEKRQNSTTRISDIPANPHTKPKRKETHCPLSRVVAASSGMTSTCSPSSNSTTSNSKLEHSSKRASVNKWEHRKMRGRLYKS